MEHDLTIITVEEINDLEKTDIVAEPAPFTDPTASWVYWTYLDNEMQGVPTDWVWERLRLKRDTFLAACDYRMITDAPWDVAPWVTYRQALRDLPKTTKDPRLAEWPEAPE
jgi:hypothetical protein